MNPQDFLSREQFDQLSDDEATRYIESVHSRIESEYDTSRKLRIATHFLDVLEWILPPEVYEQTVRRPAWDLSWRNAEAFLALFEQYAASAPEAERERIGYYIDQLRPIVDHKRALDDLGETDDAA